MSGYVGMRPGHAKRGRHTFPAMTGLACEVGDLMHGQGEENRTLFPLNESRGEERERER